LLKGVEEKRHIIALPGHDILVGGRFSGDFFVSGMTSLVAVSSLARSRSKEDCHPALDAGSRKTGKEKKTGSRIALSLVRDDKSF